MYKINRMIKLLLSKQKLALNLGQKSLFSLNNSNFYSKNDLNVESNKIIVPYINLNKPTIGRTVGKINI